MPPLIFLVRPSWITLPPFRFRPITVATASARGISRAETWLIGCTEKAAVRPAGKARFSWGLDDVIGCTAINSYQYDAGSILIVKHINFAVINKMCDAVHSNIEYIPLYGRQDLS